MLKLLKDLLKPQKTAYSAAALQVATYHDGSAELSCFSRYEPLFSRAAGLEIGGPSHAVFGIDGFMPVYLSAAHIDNCNFSAATVWEGDVREGATFVFNPQKPPGRQFIAEASALDAIADESYDYVLSSHCIEHMANPLKGIREWRRVLRPGGVLALVVPHKDGTFDRHRPVTAFEHLVADHDAGMPESDLTHLDEIIALHDFGRDPQAGSPEQFRERALRNAENRCLHQHVFNTWVAVQAVDWAGLQLEAVELFLPMHIAIIARKPAGGEPVDNAPYLTGAAWASPFASDR
jgi:SAM-dependent methyltransferase